MTGQQGQANAVISALPTRVSGLADLIRARNPMHRRALDAALQKLREKDLRTLETYLEFCSIACGLSPDYLCECYLTIVTDTLSEQIYFQKYKKYRHSSFADVAGDVYFSKEYMARYMYGLAITSFFWPNHQQIMRFFERSLPRGRRGKYLEVGPGHGFFFMTAMAIGAFDEFEGVDISETSVNMTRRIIDFYGAGKGRQARIALKDFLEADIPLASCSAVVMGEVLEHLEKPELFLKRIAAVAADDAWIFVTTCCNAPAVDHIYLFREPAAVESLFAEAGLLLKDSLILPCEGQTLERSLKQGLPVNVAYVLAKQP